MSVRVFFASLHMDIRTTVLHTVLCTNLWWKVTEIVRQRKLSSWKYQWRPPFPGREKYFISSTRLFFFLGTSYFYFIVREHVKEWSDERCLVTTADQNSKLAYKIAWRKVVAGLSSHLSLGLFIKLWIASQHDVQLLVIV